MGKRHQPSDDTVTGDNPDLEEVDPADESLASPGAERILEEIIEHHSAGTGLVGSDLDADWQSASDVGDEAVGGHAPTPDQDEVDAIGRSLGVEQESDAEVQTHEDILASRDKDRWELDRRSADEDSDTSS